jgi:hypothetical protein
MKDGSRLRVQTDKKAEHDGKPVADAKYDGKTPGFCFGGQISPPNCAVVIPAATR